MPLAAFFWWSIAKYLAVATANKIAAKKVEFLRKVLRERMAKKAARPPGGGTGT